MNKKMYIPKSYELQEMSCIEDVNVYKYLLAKSVEKILIKNDITNEELTDIPELEESICYIYPEKINQFPRQKDNMDLCAKIINKNPKNEIYFLDFLGDFSKEVQKDYNIMLIAIDILQKKLPSNPEYRFEYNKSITLDKIFLIDLLYFNRHSKFIINKLMEIDPIYGLKAEKIYGRLGRDYLYAATEEYANRYGIPKGTHNCNIFSDSKAKKLIKYLNK